MIISLEGENSTGKTTLGYTAPLKIVGFAFDLGIERALFGSGRFDGLDISIVPYTPDAEPPPFTADITIFELPQPLQFDESRARGYTKLWNYFIMRAGAAFKDESVRSLVLDTATLARRIKADSYLEELQKDSVAKNKEVRQQLIQIEWAKPNDALRDFYTTSEGCKKNLIAIHHLTDERKDSVDRDGKIVQGMLTGNRILEGFNQTYRFVDVALRMTKKGAAIEGKWVKCGYSLAIEGTTIENPDWNKLVDVIEMATGNRMKLERRV